MAPSPAREREGVDLVLHIGSGKTGTSSIQYFLHRHRARLATLGLLYPQTPGRTRHLRLGVYIRPDDELDRNLGWHRMAVTDPAVFRRRFRRRLLREIDESGLSHVLLSDEGLYGSSNAALRQLRRLTDEIARSVRLIVYLRRQDDHLISRYQQVVKVGEVRRIEEWARPDHAKTYDYHARLTAWREEVGPAEFVVRRFERESFVEGSLHQDFLDAARIPMRADQFDRDETRNESLDAESVEFLRVLNILRVLEHGVDQMQLDNRKLVARLAEESAGPALTLPASHLDAVMARWEESNRAVAREFLGDPEGRLFTMPRKTANTTVEQRLEPARVDHFAQLLEIPEEWHAPLRRIAEREARGS